MAWTLPTGLFFVAIGSALLVLTVWELRSPSVTRRGFLPLATSRGDRFFISLLVAAFLHILFLGLTDWPVWWMSVGSIGSTLLIMRPGLIVQTKPVIYQSEYRNMTSNMQENLSKVLRAPWFALSITGAAVLLVGCGFR